jgi:hypothetical protein
LGTPKTPNFFTELLIGIEILDKIIELDNEIEDPPYKPLNDIRFNHKGELVLISDK